jgi:uncharacterized OB-fold protein
MTRIGKVYSYTIVYSAAEAFKNQTPYAIAIVDEAEKRVVSMIEGYDANRTMKIGMDVEFAHEDAHGNPVYKFPSCCSK